MVWYARDKSSPRTTTFEGAHGSSHARSGRGSSAAIAACKTQGYGVSVVVADRTGTPKVVIVRDGPRGVGPEVARRKAYTAAMQRVSTGDFTKRVSAPGAFNPGIYDKELSTGEGGVPPELPAALALWLASDDSHGLTGKLISAPYDGWRGWDERRISGLNTSPWFTLRRIDHATLRPLIDTITDDVG